MNKITQAIAEFGLFEYNPEKSINDTAFQGLEEFGYDAFCELAKEVNAETHRYISEHSNYSDVINKNISTQYELRKYEKIRLTEDVINGNAALIRHNIDFSYISEYKGEPLTNYQRMERGLAPIDLQTGKPIELHHIGQYRDSPLAELTHEEHDDKNKVFHYELPTDVHDDNQAWRLQRQQHWKDRARIERERIELNKNIENIVCEIGANIAVEKSATYLEKEINGKTWRILTIDNHNKTIDVVVDIKNYPRKGIATGIRPEDIRISGYRVRTIHEVRGPLARLMDAESGRMITRKSGEAAFIRMKTAELTLQNGDIVRYNTWDFEPYALYRSELSAETILCESPEHKREFILNLADSFCTGNPELQEKFTSEIEQQLRRIHQTRSAPAYLNGYEIHHNGYGEMLLLPNDIHCRKLSHIGGSWLMNVKNYEVYIEEPIDLSNIKSVVEQTLTPERMKTFESLSIAEKEQFILLFGNEILDGIGLSDVKIECVDDLGSMTCGRCNYKQKAIQLNRKFLDSPYGIIHTELHEIRHAIQHDAITHPNKYGFDAKTLEKWANNIEYYIKPELDYEAYITQPIELDAELWASEMLHDVKHVLYV